MRITMIYHDNIRGESCVTVIRRRMIDDRRQYMTQFAVRARARRELRPRSLILQTSGLFVDLQPDTHRTERGRECMWARGEASNSVTYRYLDYFLFLFYSGVFFRAIGE